MPDMSALMAGSSMLIFGAVAIPFVIIAAIFVIWMLRNRRRADVSGHWNRTTGRILQSQVEARRTRSGNGYGTSYYPVIIYEYAINGQRYQNDRINFGPELGFSSTGPSETVVGRYHIGNAVDVYFDPANPAESVLERTAGGGNNILLFVAGLIVVILLCTGVVTIGGLAFSGNLVNSITSQVNGVLTQVPKR